MQRFALEEAKAAFNITNYAGSAGDWERVDTMFSRFDDIRRGFPQSRRDCAYGGQSRL